MAEQPTMNQPTAKYRSDYQSPDFTITDILLEFDLQDTATRVVAVHNVKRLNPEATSLVVDGDDLTLVRVEVDGQAWTDFTEGESTLTINQLPETCELLIETEINPEANTLLEACTNQVVHSVLNVKQKASVVLLTTWIARMYWHVSRQK